MEYLFSYKKKSETKETTEEFYLNSRDNEISGKPLNYNSLQYYPFNELLCVLFDESICIIDIKTSLVDSLDIINQLVYEDIYKTLIKRDKQTSKKSENKKTSGNIDSIIPSFIYHPSDKIIVREIKMIESHIISLFFTVIISFEHNEILIFNLNMNKFFSEIPNFSLILNAKNNLEIYNQLVKTLQTQKSTDKNSNSKMIISILDSGINNNQSYNNDYYEFMTIGVCEGNEINLLIISNCFTKTRTLETNISILVNIKLYFNPVFRFSCFSQKNKSKTIAFITPDLNIAYLSFQYDETISKGKPSYKLKKMANEFNIGLNYFDQIKINKDLMLSMNFKQQLTYKKIYFSRKTSINFLEVTRIDDKQYMIIAKINNIMIFEIDNNEAIFRYQINFNQFIDSSIINAYFTKDKKIYVFNKQSEYGFENLEGKDNQIIDNQNIFSFQMSNELFGIQIHNSEIGFYTLTTKNLFKQNHLSIQIIHLTSNKYTIRELTNRKDIKLNEILCLIQKDICEIKSEITNYKTKNGFDDFNSYLLYLKTLLYFKRMNDGNNNYKDEIFTEIFDLVYGKFCLKNVDYHKFNCEFCNEKIVDIQYHENTMKCANNHSAFICCLSKSSINDQSAYCGKCLIFFNLEVIDSLGIFPKYVCKVCDNKLSI